MNRSILVLRNFVIVAKRVKSIVLLTRYLRRETQQLELIPLGKHAMC